MKIVTNASINFERVTQAQLNKIERLHDEHSEDIKHANDTIDHRDTALNYHATPLNLNELLEEQYGEMIAVKNSKLDEQLSDGKISKSRYNERHMTIDKYLNHSGKDAKKAFTLGVVYIGDEQQTKDKLDKLGFDYDVVRMKGSDGQYHNHFHLSDPAQRKQWRKLWVDTFSKYVTEINRYNGGIKVFDYTVHLDESSPHLHMKMLNMGHSKNGRPSYNLNQALNDFIVATKLHKPLLSRPTTKTPTKRVSGSATMAYANRIFSALGIASFRSAAKSFTKSNIEWERKGDKAKLTNQMTAKEFKEYKAELQSLHDAYVSIVGEQPLPGDTISGAVKKAVEKLSEDKKAVDDEKDQLNQKRSEVAQMAKNAQFNSFVQHQFIMQLEERRKDKLRKLKQREEELKQQENELVTTVTEKVLEAIKKPLQSVLDDIKLSIRGNLDAFGKRLLSAETARSKVEHNSKYNHRRFNNFVTNIHDENVIGGIVKNAVNAEVKKQQSDQKQDNEKDDGMTL